jgi:hypothetical protein
MKQGLSLIVRRPSSRRLSPVSPNCELLQSTGAGRPHSSWKDHRNTEGSPVSFSLFLSLSWKICSHGELKPCNWGAGLSLRLSASVFALAKHRCWTPFGGHTLYVTWFSFWKKSLLLQIVNAGLSPLTLTLTDCSCERFSGVKRPDSRFRLFKPSPSRRPLMLGFHHPCGEQAVPGILFKPLHLQNLSMTALELLSFSVI